MQFDENLPCNLTFKADGLSRTPSTLALNISGSADSSEMSQPTRCMTALAFSLSSSA